MGAMTNHVHFPGLGLDFLINNVAFYLFGMPVYWYGITITFGMILAIIFVLSQAKLFGLNSDRMIDIIVVGVFTALLGGRLYYVFFIDSSYANIWDMLNLRQGGIAIYGAIIGAFIGGYIMCRIRKVNVPAFFDDISMGFLIGQAIGRWANFFNQEAFGSNTNLPWGMISEETTKYLENRQDWLAGNGVIVDPNMPVHPTFLYESIWCALGFLVLFLYRKHRKFNGEMSLFYVMWYGAGRCVIEGLRTDSLMIANTNIRTSQLLAALSVIVSFAAWIIIKVKMKGKPLQVPTPPDNTAKVRIVDKEGVRQKVTVAWPANTKAPNKEQKLQMAIDVLQGKGE